MVKCPSCGYKKVWETTPKWDNNSNIVIDCECQNVECNHKWTGHFELVEIKETK